jgi:hypothetical protein
MDDKTRLSRLLDLNQKLAYVGYEKLGLCHLDLLKNETKYAIDQITNKNGETDDIGIDRI